MTGSGAEHDTVRGRADDTGDGEVAVKGPIAGEVFLEDTISADEA